MKVTLYKNDGTGRDAYVNNANMSDSRRAALKNPAAVEVHAFWPTPSPLRERKLGLEGTRFPAVATPRRDALAAAASLPRLSLSPSGTYTSPRHSSPRFGLDGAVSPRSPLAVDDRVVSARALAALRHPAPIESTLRHAQRTGRYDNAADAPAFDGRLPGLHQRLHQGIGVLDEV